MDIIFYMARENNKIIILLCGLLIFLFSFIIYFDSFKNGFLAGDDEEIVLRNTYLNNWGDFPKFFTENYKAGSGTISNYWRPFQLLPYGIIAKTTGIKPWPFHFSSILFHSLCGLLLYLLFLKLLYPRITLPVIVFTDMLWLSLPAHNEELAVATGLASPLHLFWMLLGLLAFLYFNDGQKIRWYIISLISFVFSLFSKESAVVFPGLILGVQLAGMRAGILKEIRPAKLLRIFSPFWLIAFIYIILRLTLFNFSNTLNFYSQANIFTEHLLYRLYTLFTILARGLVIIFFPVGIHPETSWPVFTNFLAPQVFLSFLILSAMIILAVINWKKRPLFTFGIFWFFFSYLPMANLVAKINALVWDHWLYIPSVGIFLSLASLLQGKLIRRAACFILVTLLIILSILTFSRSRYWRDTEAISSFILRHEPASAKTWNNLATALDGKGRYQEAIASYAKAIDIEDIYPQSHHNLANVYLALGKYGLAEEEYLKAIKMDGNFFYSYLALGKLYLAWGEKEKAGYFIRKALSIYPGSLEARELSRRLPN
ncbi:tetratricopeptide repeat protein [bacterium]|nr:MAG: tetratricopeptide repeat protein [bacterium]